MCIRYLTSVLCPECQERLETLQELNICPDRNDFDGTNLSDCDYGVEDIQQPGRSRRIPCAACRPVFRDTTNPLAKSGKHSSPSKTRSFGKELEEMTYKPRGEIAAPTVKAPWATFQAPTPAISLAEIEAAAKKGKNKIAEKSTKGMGAKNEEDVTADNPQPLEFSFKVALGKKARQAASSVSSLQGPSPAKRSQIGISSLVTEAKPGAWRSRRVASHENIPQPESSASPPPNATTSEAKPACLWNVGRPEESPLHAVDVPIAAKTTTPSPPPKETAIDKQIKTPPPTTRTPSPVKMEIKAAPQQSMPEIADKKVAREDEVDPWW